MKTRSSSRSSFACASRIASKYVMLMTLPYQMVQSSNAGSMSRCIDLTNYAVFSSSLDRFHVVDKIPHRYGTPVFLLTFGGSLLLCGGDCFIDFADCFFTPLRQGFPIGQLRVQDGLFGHGQT